MTKPANLMHALALTQNHMNPALQRVAAYILENPEHSKNITIKELATACEVAESTVTRFVKELGFENFRQLKIALAESLIHAEAPAEDESVYDAVSREDSIEEMLDKISFQTIQKLREARALLQPEEMNRAVAMISAADTVFFASTGSSSVATEEAIIRFTRAGKRCAFWKDASMQAMVSATLGSGDVVVGISDTGRTLSVVNALKNAAERGAGTIAITSTPKSQLAAAAQVVLLTPPRQTSGDRRDPWESTTAKSSQLFLIDCLYVRYAMQNYDTVAENLAATQAALKAGRI